MAARTLDWTVNEYGQPVARVGATTYIVGGAWKLPTLRAFDVYVTHAELDRDENGDTTLVYQGYGFTVEEAKQFAEILHHAPLGDDTAKKEWNRQQHRRLTALVQEMVKK